MCYNSNIRKNTKIESEWLHMAKVIRTVQTVKGLELQVLGGGDLQNVVVNSKEIVGRDVFNSVLWRASAVDNNADDILTLNVDQFLHIDILNTYRDFLEKNKVDGDPLNIL